ncbi:single-strand DNA endonuclease 1-like [Castanea sativa]|uniref:single-strand DNA endonuclease 1-like n=1 Tax=Castanea sativa TaxID=21020 RepID=UPI003F64FA35
MGVKNLWDILESCKKTLPLHHLQSKRVCIYLSCWMVQLQNVNKSHSCMKEKVYLRDGSIPASKLSTYRRRLNSGSEDGCFTLDSDVFLFGARTVYRDVCLGYGGYVTSYEMTDIEGWLGFGRNSLGLAQYPF